MPSARKIYAKLRDLASSSDSSKEREKLENSRERLRCDVSQVRAYLTKATENGSKLTIGGLSNLPSTDDLVLALVDARENGGLEAAYNFHKDQNGRKTRRPIRTIVNRVRKGITETHSSPTAVVLRRRSTSKQKLRSF